MKSPELRFVDFPPVLDPTQHWHVHIREKPSGQLLHAVCSGGSGTVNVDLSGGAEELVDVEVVSMGVGRRSN